MFHNCTDDNNYNRTRDSQQTNTSQGSSCTTWRFRKNCPNFSPNIRHAIYVSAVMTLTQFIFGYYCAIKLFFEWFLFPYKQCKAVLLLSRFILQKKCILCKNYYCLRGNVGPTKYHNKEYKNRFNKVISWDKKKIINLITII